MTSSPALQISHVSVSYGQRRVLDDVDLKMESGTVLGLLGVNGAGKSTLISVATGLRPVDTGRVLVRGIDVSRDRLAAARHIGLAPQRLGVYPTLSARDNLMIFAELARLRPRAARLRVDETLELLGLDAHADRVVGTLSGGQQRRIHTGMALVARPNVLFLDEPTVGADGESRHRMLRTVRELADQGAAVLYTSHVLPEFAELGAQIAVLHEGRVSPPRPIPDLLRDHARASLELRFRAVAPALRGWHRRDHRTLSRTVQLGAGPALRDAMVALEADAPLLEDLVDVHLRQPDLEDVLRTLTRSGPHRPPGATALGSKACAETSGARR